MAYYRATFSYGTTGSKNLSTPLGGATPIGARITMGARVNTTETGAIFSQGGTDGTRTHCISTAPSFTKKWPYTAESNYIIAHHNTAGTKVFSATFTSFAADQMTINVDVADANYQLIVEVWS